MRAVLQLNFHLKIVNPIFAAVVEALPTFRVGMAQALHNTENWKRMAEGNEPVIVPQLPATATAAATADTADPPSTATTPGTDGTAPC